MIVNRKITSIITNIVAVAAFLFVLPILLPVFAATFNLVPSSGNFPMECRRSIEVYADVTGQSSNAADLILFYNPAEVVIIDADPDTPGKQVFTGNAYAAYAANQVDEGLGRIRMTAFSIGSNLTTNRLFARIDFTPLAGVTSTSFTIQFDGVGQTLDSNIANSINSLDLLTGVTNATYTFTPGLCENDTIRPNIQFVQPVSGATGVPLNSNVQIRLTDNLSGIDLSTLEILINGDPYNASSPQLTISGDALNYLVLIDPINDFFDGAASTIFVRVRDVAGNERSRTNVFNVPPVAPPPPPPPVEPPTCDCGDPISYLINSPLVVNTGSEFIDGLLNPTLSNLGVTGAGAALTGLALLASILAGILPLISLLNAPGLLFNLLSFFVGRRHGKPWGIVIDTVTNKPIPFATCRLYVAETTNLITQTVSDIEGKYGFVITPGSYRLEIRHNDYSTYSENFTILEGQEAYLKDVRLIPKSMQKQVSSSEFTDRWNRFTAWLKAFWLKARPFVFTIGFTLAVISVAILPSTLNYIILGLYILTLGLIILHKLAQGSKYAAVIDSTTNLRIPYAVVKFYNTQNWQLVDTQVTNANGLFDFIGQPGEYAILVAVRGYQFPSNKQTDLEVITEKYSGMLRANLSNGGNRITLLVDPVGGQNPQNDLPASNNLATPFS